MIARDVEFVDLSPTAWRNMLSLMDISKNNDTRPEHPNLLSVLHHGGKVLRVYAPAGYRVPTLEKIDDPQELAKKLYYQLPGLDRVQILETESLASFSDQVQRIEWQSLDAEDFHFRAHLLAEQDPAGLCFYPVFTRSWNGLSLNEMRSWAEAGPDPSAYFLGVTRDSSPWATLILRVEGKKLRLVTTVEYLAKFNLSVDQWPSSPLDLGPICEAISTHVAPVRAALVCDYFVLARLLASEDKRRDLMSVTAEGSAASIGLLV
jgi:hypothetical protein